ncbi:MAG: glycosyltransferase [Bacteroides sp.]|nr:glycosyltransferase [Bacteroides sp.]MCM1447849.1 glycosyltransferase [Bacteroides sp.]
MTILFYLTRFPGFGGIETVTELIGCELLKKGHHITILSHMRQDRPSELVAQSKFHLFPKTESLYNTENLLFAETVVENTRFDAIVYQDSYAPSEKIVCHISRKYHIPLYVFEHNTPLNNVQSRKMHDCKNLPFKLWRNLFAYPMEDRRCRSRHKLLLNTCTKYVLLSKYFIEDLSFIMKGNVNMEKLAYINNPIAYSPFEEDKLEKKENIVLCVCRLETVKRVNLMLDMWKKLDVKDYRFVVVGDGCQRKALEDKVTRENIKNIEFVGFTNPIPYYERAKVFWMTSQFEGWGGDFVRSNAKRMRPSRV